MSYMGKGVTKAATMCLRHLVYEMASTAENKVSVDLITGKFLGDIFWLAGKYMKYDIPNIMVLEHVFTEMGRAVDICSAES